MGGDAGRRAQDDARRAAKAVVLGAMGQGSPLPVVAQVTVPTDKAGLIAWLNANMQPQRVEK